MTIDHINIDINIWNDVWAIVKYNVGNKGRNDVNVNVKDNIHDKVWENVQVNVSRNVMSIMNDKTFSDEQILVAFSNLELL